MAYKWKLPQMQTYLATDVGASVFFRTVHETPKTTQADKTVWKGSLAFPSWKSTTPFSYETATSQNVSFFEKALSSGRTQHVLCIKT